MSAWDLFPRRLAGRALVWQNRRRENQPTLSREVAALGALSPKPDGHEARSLKGAARPFVYRQQYGLIVVCSDEADQRRKYERLRKRGYKLRVVTV